MQIQQNFSLKSYNTFGIEAFANNFISVTTTNELIQILEKNPTDKKFILGGGSNLLLTQNIDALVIHINIKGISIVSETESDVVIRCNSGENWHEFVLFCIENNYGGLENMSLIPGNVGTTPVQNIGAYGVEIKDSLVSCEAINIKTQALKTFSNSECKFGYRESVFKNQVKGEYIIVSVDFRLTKKNHKINIGYGDIKAELEEQKIQNPTIKNVSDAIIAIRQSKLPDPKVLGNSGSFFKNPIISLEKFEIAKQKFPDIKSFKISETAVKVPAGWLIERAGFKGKRFDDAGIHEKQALVLVNYGNATGAEILALSQNIQKTVLDKFGIWIEAEVNVV